MYLKAVSDPYQSESLCAGMGFSAFGAGVVKNPVLPQEALPHGVSSKEKAILVIHPLPLEGGPSL